MSLKIDLSHHTDKFIPGSQELIIEKKVNFIFGKNGTGKTTIADEIKNQLTSTYDVCVFKDFAGVAENERLNAVALGTENATIQGKINTIDTEIAGIIKQTEQPDNNKEDTFYTRAIKAQKAFQDQDKKIKDFYTSAARDIKNIKNPQIAETTYDTRGFQQDKANAIVLSDEDVSGYKNIIKSDQKPDVSLVTFPDIELQSYLDSTNEILQSSVAQSQDIPGLKDNAEKQAFARQGMSIHEHTADEQCAFCGGKISEERWRLLGSYFNDEVKKLEGRIGKGLEKIKFGLSQFDSLKDLKVSDFYDKFSEDVKNLNMQIKISGNDYKDFLARLQAALEEKRGNLFTETDALDINIPKDFSDVKKACGKLVEEHNKLSKNLKDEQNKAKDALRYHEVKKKLDEFKYDEENGKLTALITAKNVAQKALEVEKDGLKTKQDERKGLILQTRDEEKIAEKINKLLGSMGAVSFSLKLVNDGAEGQQGQYQIEGHDGKIRPVTNMSSGEKNIIAFLYFIFGLESVDRNSKPKIIVLDDPMTSNDDTMQYLMIGEIQKLYRALKDSSYMVVLTHNCHFYLNVRPNTMPVYEKSQEDEELYERIGFYEKYGVYHLFSNGYLASIKNITDGKQDFKTSYEALWKELVFLYEANAPDLMLNPCRKICETYLKFTKQDVMVFYRDNINAKKLFDVNQHSIDDFEAEPNGKTKDEIKNILFELFKANDAENHFKSHWKGGAK